MIAWLPLALVLAAPPPSDSAPPPPTVLLNGEWRFHAGDDPRWADPALDDEDWRLIGVPGAWEEQGVPGYDGYAWYRRPVELPAGVAEGPVGVRVGTVGDVVQVFWNGVPIGRKGSFPPDVVEGVTPALFLVPAEALQRRTGPLHLLAVRVYNDYAYGGLMGGVRIGRYDVLASRRSPGELAIGALISFFLAAGVYHLAFFFRRWRARENLYFALLCASAALYGATFSLTFAELVIEHVNPYRLRLLTLLAAGPIYLPLIARLFDLRLGRYARIALAVLAGLLPVVLVLPLGLVGELHHLISLGVGAGLLASAAWVTARASTRASYTRILAAGVAVLSAAMIWDLLSEHAIVPVARVVPGAPGMFWIGFLAFVIAVGMATAGNFAEAEVNARIDPLTGLVRRHVFEEALTREAERRRRAGGMLTLLIIDLDNFKQVNDGYGHRVGDEVLARIGHLLRHNARNIDLTSRLGGEEFAVLLSDTDADGAMSFIQRFRQRLASLEVPVSNGAVISEMTASVGIAVSTGWVDTDALLDAADDAMYRAKKAGRDRVVTVNLPLDWPGRPSSLSPAPE